MNFEDYFSVQIFFIILRETLETAIVISVLLSFINQRSQELSDGRNPANEAAHVRGLRVQVWAGALMGFVVCFAIGVAFVVAFYVVGENYWSYAERLWEGIFSLLSSVIITVMGIGLLRINRVMKVKWFAKLGDAFDSHSHKGRRRKYFLALLPFITTLREGLEAVVFVGGIGLSSPVSSIPFSIASGIGVGSTIGYTLYKGGNKLSLQYFLILSTCFLYIVSAGLMSRGVWFLELESYVRKCGGLDVSETGSGPGSYDPATSVWHVNCCNGLTDGWWMVLNALVGWTNSATYGSVGAYCAYWILVIAWLEVRLYEEHHGLLPFVPVRWQLRRIRKKIKLYEARAKHGAAIEAETEAELLME